MRRRLLLCVTALVACAWIPSAQAQHAPRVVRPGAPGQPSQVLEDPALARPEGPRYVQADVAFMQGMIHHHAQAIEMTALAPARTTNRALLTLAEKIQVSQGDEIAWMQRWLRARGEAAPEVAMNHGEMQHEGMQHDQMQHDAGEMQHDADMHAMHHDSTGACQTETCRMHHEMLMPGMLNAEEMARLAAARDADFDRWFLLYMIRHHEGGLIMVADLLATEGGAQAPEVYRFATDIDADQRADIRRMTGMLDVPPLPAPVRAHRP